MIALYPIKPFYIQRILSGEKRFELRRSVPKNSLDYIVFYSTSPQSKVVGYAKVKNIISSNPKDLWRTVRSQAGITKEEYDKYFDKTDKAYAIAFDVVYKFENAFDLKSLDSGMTVPQSFCYLDKLIFKRLQRRKCVEI